MDGASYSSGEMYLKVMCAFIFVVALMFAFSWLLRRMGLATPGLNAGARRRLKVVEHLPLDARRRLVLVRRDGAEHLLLIGGTGGDVLVEAGITPPVQEAQAEAAPNIDAKPLIDAKDVAHA